MAIYRLPVDPEWQVHLRSVVDVMPVMAYVDGERTGEQATDRASGYLMWELAVTLKTAEDRKAETIYVRVPAPKAPDLIGQKPVFGGLEADKPAYVNKRGDNVSVDSAWKFTAISVAATPPPSARRGEPSIPDNHKTPAPASA
jgi:hypothetical protein